MIFIKRQVDIDQLCCRKMLQAIDVLFDDAVFNAGILCFFHLPQSSAQHLCASRPACHAVCDLEEFCPPAQLIGCTPAQPAAGTILAEVTGVVSFGTTYHGGRNCIGLELRLGEFAVGMICCADPLEVCSFFLRSG